MRIRWRDLELPNRLVVETEDESYGKFVVEPFERGFGTTIGNSLRRVLLSSIEGSAITFCSVKANDEPILHEYSAVEGIYEDFTDIILNVKRINVVSDLEAPVTVTLYKEFSEDDDKSGEVVVTAGDIETVDGVEILNTDWPIATLVKPGTKLEMELTIQRGRGYVQAEQNAEAHGERRHGVIYVDSIFSPIERVRYKTENTRVGKMTNFDKLIVEIWTNGTIRPRLALVEATKILRKHLNPFVSLFMHGQELPIEAKESTIETDDGSLESLLGKNINDLNISHRALNCLKAEGIITVKELVQHNEEDLLRIHNFGKTTLGEIKRKLEILGLSLGMSMENARALIEAEKEKEAEQA